MSSTGEWGLCGAPAPLDLSRWVRDLLSIRLARACSAKTLVTSHHTARTARKIPHACRIFGSLVLVNRKQVKEVAMKTNPQPNVHNPQLDRRLNDIGWGLSSC